MMLRSVSARKLFKVFFSDAIKLNEHNLLSRVGYGQCLVVRKEFQDAIRTFEKIQESNSRILEVTYALGMLYSQNAKTYNRAIVFLEKYVKLATDQNETISLAALLALSRVYEEKDISQSLKYLQLARDQELASGKSQIEVSYALLNNIGVFTLLKNDTQAAELFGDAETALKNQESDEVADALSVTLKYNIARTKESTNKPEDIKDAMKLYEEILERTPNYISAKLRWLLLSCTSENKIILWLVREKVWQEAPNQYRQV
ncbi:unnamed protein product [Ambrosiozyma monospora]|uniref:Unnamed protein product n=1 Tax=Ambrosiozyma monospora TaxID=43982 RepID=A0A9W6SZA4_AMBMO|nr:unnamed protein product [Ambrosiozyma monospora]